MVYQEIVKVFKAVCLRSKMGDLIWIGIFTLVASFLGTITGFGTSTIMVPVMALFFPLGQSLLFVGVLHLFNDTWKVLLFKGGINWRLILLFGVPGIFATFVGARMVLSFSEDLLSTILGSFLLFYAIFILAFPRFKLKKGNGVAVTGGALSGFIAGIFGVGGGVRAVFLSAFNLHKEVYIATIGAIAFVVDATRVITYFSEGIRIGSELTYGLLFFIPLSFVGAFFAKKIVDRLPQKYFRDIVALFILVVGMGLIIW